MIDRLRNKCFGCTACGEMCPVGAIGFEKDIMGFLYPQISSDICIQCNKCEKICPVISFRNTVNERNRLAFAVRHKNTKEVETSRSGAAFSAISDVILAQGGVVYGASFDKDFYIRHSEALDKESCKKFKGSKYVQSDVRGVIRSIKDELTQGKKVLFSGTPCQVAGLKSCLSNELAANLYVVDIVCHGVPSPQLWLDYINYLKKCYKGELKVFDFRDKSINGWSDHIESFIVDDKKYSSKVFTNLFYSNSFFRESCYSCPFANLSREGDITLADFWGWEIIDKNLNIDDKGISLVLVNNEKGKILFEKAKQVLKVKEVAIEKSLQPNLIRPTKEPVNRNEFLEYYNKRGFDKLVQYFTTPSLIQKIEMKIRKIIHKYGRKG